ncbi:MAG: hypothetical protein H0U10_08365 [Chloroflexia bacterium]|nr:hypothetical protein [Chloroflexia bacterium]
MRDGDGVAALFEAGATLVAGGERAVRGGAAITRVALATWVGDRTNVANPRRSCWRAMLRWSSPSGASTCCAAATTAAGATRSSSRRAKTEPRRSAG